MDEDVDDVVAPNLLAEELPLHGVQQQVHRCVVLHHERHHAARVQDGDQVLAAEIVNVGVLGNVVAVVGNEASVESGRIGREGDREKGQREKKRAHAALAAPCLRRRSRSGAAAQSARHRE